MKKRDIGITIVVILVVAAVAYGLSRRSRGLPLTPSSPATAASTESKKSEGKVIMRVNGEPITEAEFNTLAQAAPAESRGFYATPAGRRAMADELVKLKALEQEGMRMHLTDDPAVQTQIAMMRGQVIAGKALEKLVDQKTEAMIQKEYAAQKGKAMSLRHIAIAYDGGQIPPRDPHAKLSAQQAMAKAQAIVKQLRGGVDFGATAAASSDDMQSAQKGGMLGPVQPDGLPPDIAAVVSKMKPGEISAPLKTQFAVHIFKTEEPSLEDLRPMLAQQVKQQAAKEEVDRLQKAAKVDLDPKFFPEGVPESALPPTQKPLQ
ncbi:MAG TPA: peptidylprolyl isomerase [Thermoanaerobaculia bacterium]|nr:peptidylprolyl isomerase [Thermoanaerobaculia bacterium]